MSSQEIVSMQEFIEHVGPLVRTYGPAFLMPCAALLGFGILHFAVGTIKTLLFGE